VNDLVHRTALVTGASRGIGRAIARRLAADGALVAVHYATNSDAADEVVEEITRADGQAFAVQADFAVTGGVEQLVGAVTATLTDRTGSAGLDILVNNAGIMGGVAPDKLTVERFDQLMAVNARAPFFLVQQLLPALRDHGRIISVSSALTRMALPDEIAYAMSKAALEMIGLHFARHLGPRGITVNTVAPGVTDNGSDMLQVPEIRDTMAKSTAFARIGEPADIADVIAFLASDHSRWITDGWLDVSGGTLLG
jgi:bifunctional oxygenase/reductase